MFQNDAYAIGPYLAHYLFGFPALAAIIVALISTKGSTLHVWAGRVFVTGMIIAALTAYYFITIQFSPPALFDATLMIISAGSAVLAFRSNSLAVSTIEWIFTVISVLATLALTAVGIQFLSSGIANVAPAFIHGSVFASFVIGDIRFKRSGRAQEKRVHRHLYRMSWAAAIGVYAPMFTFREVFGLSQPVVYLGSMALAPVICVLFWSTATKIKNGQ